MNPEDTKLAVLLVEQISNECKKLDEGKTVDGKLVWVCLEKLRKISDKTNGVPPEVFAAFLPELQTICFDGMLGNLAKIFIQHKPK